MPQHPFVAAIDWGSTRLRIWLIDRQGLVLAERRSEEGALGAGAAGFAAILERHLAALDAPRDLPTIICGMAGSRQGWIEVPYVDVPATLDAPFAGATQVSGTPRPVWIIPGIAQREASAPDVMRGEETQIAGALGNDDLSATVCLPGTHSKWATIAAGRITHFRTVPTGELFALIASQSILRHALRPERIGVAPGNPVFAAWCLDAIAHPHTVTQRLFSIRASSLLLGMTPEDAEAALSGLLIGGEIGAVRGTLSAEVVLVASGPLGALYAKALSLAGLTVVPVDAESAVRRGLLRAARQLPPS